MTELLDRGSLLKKRKKNAMTKLWTVRVAALLATLALFAPTPVAHADIFQWQYINPANPSLGKQQSTMLAPDGAGVSAMPAANLSNRNLTMAYLIGADLSAIPVYGYEWEVGYVLVGYNGASLYGGNLSQADLTNANLTYAWLTNANLSGAEVRGRLSASTLITVSAAVLRRRNCTRRPVIRPTI